MQAISSDGYKVFAINFPHKNGDGYFWSEQIADAIAIVKSKTGASEVDVSLIGKEFLKLDERARMSGHGPLQRSSFLFCSTARTPPRPHHFASPEPEG